MEVVSQIQTWMEALAETEEEQDVNLPLLLQEELAELEMIMMEEMEILLEML